MRVRKISVLAIAAVAASLALTACDSDDTEGASSSGADSSVDAPKDPAQSCTDQFDYAGDSRSNAEINTIGEETGTCPEAEGTEGAEAGDDAGGGTPKKPGLSCTDQINYAEDPRSNAEINTIGEETGTCPPVE
ncbi:hypothetical protein ACFV0Z_24720 [Streptomyces xiamenensis]|uniref:hypothetical protein n=1 Tax=Streptomyces xiamenensis TaxID=408015 RepID=UPI0036AF94E4